MTKILVIEDETPIRQNILDMLDAEGFEALAAENGQSGRHLAAERHPDLILWDVMVPEIDGCGVLTALRADKAMERAEQFGGNCWEFYTPAFNIGRSDRVALETDFRYALEREELSVCYQPHVNAPGSLAKTNNKEKT